MIISCSLHNPTRTPRIIYDGIEGSQKMIRVDPGKTVSAVLAAREVDRLRGLTDDLVVTTLPVSVSDEQPGADSSKFILITSMWGVGDCLHMRAVLRELMKTREVWLETSNLAIFHDLFSLGMKIISRSTRPPRMREESQVTSRHVPDGMPRRRVTYNSHSIERAGSVLAAQFLSCGVAMPDAPDFRLPVPSQWTERLHKNFPMARDKPLLVLRPNVLNKVWHCPLRSPDPGTYDALFRSISDRFFTVSVADLSPGAKGEWILGPEPQVDAKLDHGELDFQVMAALFAEAAVTFVSPGFAPALSQAVGTPTIIVYGGYECFATTHSHGARLTPTLPIDTDAPCRCFSQGCQRRCSKQINVASAMEKIRDFVDAHIGGKR